MCRPSSQAPTTFYLVRMVCTIVEVITHAIVGEGTATALRHGLLVPSIVGGVRQRQNDWLQIVGLEEDGF